MLHLVPVFLELVNVRLGAGDRNGGVQDIWDFRGLGPPYRWYKHLLDPLPPTAKVSLRSFFIVLNSSSLVCMASNFR